MKVTMKAVCRVSIPAVILVAITIGILAQVLALVGDTPIQDGACHSGMATHIIIVPGTVHIMAMDIMIMVGMVIIRITMIIIIHLITENLIMLPMGIETQFHPTVIMEGEVLR